MSTRARSTTAVLGTASDVLAGGALLIGVTALVGWEAGVRVLSGPVPGSPPMKANAALGVALVAVAVLAYRRTAPGSPARWAAGVAAGLAAAIGIATLCEYVFGWRLGIDELLARDHTRTSAPFPGRPAANAALGCALGGFAVLAWDVRVGRLWVTHAIAAVAGGLGLLALLGYAAGTEPLIDIAAGQRIAASAAAAVALLGGALLTARPDRGITAMLASSGTGGALFRRLLPVALLLPITVAGLTLSGERLGLYGADVATWLLATVTTATLVVLAWAMAREAQRAGAERERHEHERERMAAAAEHGTDAVVSFDLAGRVRHWGPGAERLYGWTEAEAVGHPLSELIVDVDESRDQIARIVAGEPPFQYESRRRRKDGSYVDVLLTISPWHRAGELVGITGVAIDMSDQKRRQRELTALAARWRAAARELPGAALAIVDEDLRYVEMEGEGLRRLGIDPEPMAGRPVEAASPNEAGPRGQFVTAYRDALDGRSSEIEHELRGHRWHTRVVGLDLGDGRRHAMALSFDVTELRESEERLRILFESAPIGVALIDAHEPYRLVQVNPALADLLGATAEELLGQGALTFVDPADHDATRAALRLLAEHHGGVELDARLLRDDGDAVWASMSISLVEGPDGAPRHHVLQILDVNGQAHDRRVRRGRGDARAAPRARRRLRAGLPRRAARAAAGRAARDPGRGLRA